MNAPAAYHSPLPVARSSASRMYFVAAVVITLLLFEWIRHIRATHGLHGLSPIYFILIVDFDHAAAMVSVLILVCAVLVPSNFPVAQTLRWLGEHPVSVAVGSFVLMCAGAV